MCFDTRTNTTKPKKNLKENLHVQQPVTEYQARKLWRDNKTLVRKITSAPELKHLISVKFLFKTPKLP